MYRKSIRLVIVFAGLVVAGSAQAFVGGISVGLGEMDESIGRVETSFAGDVKVETEDFTAQSRIYYSPGKVRDEMDMGGQQIVTINRFDLNKIWIIMMQGMYMEVDPDQGSEQAPQYELISREVIGPEMVNGIETTKYKSVYKTKDGKFGGFTWFTEDNIAVKGFMVHQTKGEKQRLKFEFTSLERGAQPDSLFEVPKGSQKLPMGGFPGMQGMGQMGGAGMRGYGAPPPPPPPR
ncbi:MAG: hypothetical protein QNM00_01620 [Gammaproteobacteria bacterium]|nr:hypothetical protein [Gammaproteobacteria bacterium]